MNKTIFGHVVAIKQVIDMQSGMFRMILRSPLLGRFVEDPITRVLLTDSLANVCSTLERARAVHALINTEPIEENKEALEMLQGVEDELADTRGKLVSMVHGSQLPS